MLGIYSSGKCKYVVIFSDQSKHIKYVMLCYVILLKCLLLNAHVLRSVDFCYHYTSSFVVLAYAAKLCTFNTFS
jgi:hypothetical protein